MAGSHMNSDLAIEEAARLSVSESGRWLTFTAPAGGSYDLWRISTADGRPVDVKLQLDGLRQLVEQDVPDGRAVERLELEPVIVIADPHAALGEERPQAADIGGEPPHIGDGPALLLGHPGHDHAGTPDGGQALRDGSGILAKAGDALVRGDGAEPSLVEQPGKLAGCQVRQAGELDGVIAGRRHGVEGPREVGREEVADRPQLERNLIVSHAPTIRHRTARPPGYDGLVQILRPLLLILALPAGVLGYSLGGALVAALPLPAALEGIVGLFLPLFIGGLFMAPFVVPFLDQMAKRDLAAIQARIRSTVRLRRAVRRWR
jgi:hypothetical protein